MNHKIPTRKVMKTILIIAMGTIFRINQSEPHINYMICIILYALYDINYMLIWLHIF